MLASEGVKNSLAGLLRTAGHFNSTIAQPSDHQLSKPHLAPTAAKKVGLAMPRLKSSAKDSGTSD